MVFEGCGTALVTPFRKDGSLDESTLRSLVKRQIDAGINFLVPCGTTGESPTLTRKEHLRVVEITLEEARGRVPVVAGAGGYNTAEVVELAKEVRAVGANGILSVTPYYNKPSQEGIYQHFSAIAAAAKLPIIVYNIQGRSAVNIETATLKRLAEIEYIVGVKEASGNITQMAAVIHHMPERFAVLSGDDGVTIPLVALGGRGVIATVQSDSERDDGTHAEGAVQRFCRRTRDPAQIFAADGDERHRDQSDTGEGFDGFDGIAGAGVAPSDVSPVGCQSCEDRKSSGDAWIAGRPERACRLRSKNCSTNALKPTATDIFDFFKASNMP